jgi:hypothetical protein
MGATFGLTPFCSYFIDYVECDVPVWDVTKVNKVIRIETMLHKFTNTAGNLVFLPCVSYHLPQVEGFPINFHGQMFDFSPLRLTIDCMVVIQKFTVIVFR